MSTLILDRPGLELRAEGEALALYEPDGRRGTLPVKLFHRVVMQGTVKLDTGVLGRLAELGIGCLLLSKRHARRTALLLGPAHNDAAIRLAQTRRVWDEAWCLAWARRLVRAKTRAQIRLLRQALQERPDARRPLIVALQSLQATFVTLPQLNSVESVRGLEGAAARAYFQGLAALFPPALEFTGRNRRPPRDPVNACLSLGYTLVHFDTVRACHTAGLDPLLGYYHRPSFGRESLACDLMDPVRPWLDQLIWHLFRQRRLRSEHFRQDASACLLGKAGRASFYQAYEQHAAPMRRMLRRQCSLLARQLAAEGEPLLEPADDAVDETT
jgi:CRISPR-associated protein Cas1